jgi:hypothetical protein
MIIFISKYLIILSENKIIIFAGQTLILVRAITSLTSIKTRDTLLILKIKSIIDWTNTLFYLKKIIIFKIY